MVSRGNFRLLFLTSIADIKILSEFLLRWLELLRKPSEFLVHLADNLFMIVPLGPGLRIVFIFLIPAPKI